MRRRCVASLACGASSGVRGPMLVPPLGGPVSERSRLTHPEEREEDR